MNRAHIRAASDADIESILRLQQRWFEEDSVYGFVPESREEVEAALRSYVLVAEAEDVLVGFVSGTTHTSEGSAIIPAGESFLEIDNLYVAPEFRTQGIGGALVKQLLAEAKGRGVTYAALYSATKDVRGVLGFYERHEFRSWYVQMFRKL